MTDTPIHDELTREWFAAEMALTDNLAELINDGVPAFTACRMVFTDGPTLDTDPVARRAWIESTVKQQVAVMAARLPWLKWGAA